MDEKQRRDAESAERINDKTGMKVMQGMFDF
jgi:hypothetical protein